MQFTLSDLWSHMGLFARVIVGVMGAMSLASLFVASERLLTFRKARKNSRAFLLDLAPLLVRRDIEAAAAMPLEGESGYVGRVLSAGLKAYRVSPKGDADLSFELVARALERQTERETQNMKRGQSLLATVSSTAPFVGLLGTVMGIVNSFQQMAASGSGGLATVSAGISEALVTTAFGLLVAIPAVMIYNYFQSVMEAVTVDISESANELLDVVATQAKAQPGAGLWPTAAA
jgi:biopolymer transport protein ExbB/biopolymer transport protein TolQ